MGLAVNFRGRPLSGRRLLDALLRRQRATSLVLLPYAAWLWRRLMLRTTFIAVGGSVGKSTTKEILAAILSVDYATAKSPGTWNGLRTGNLARSVLRVRPWHRYAIIEVGVRDPGDMLRAGRIVRPDIALMLAVKRCHTMTLNDLDGVAREKATLLQCLRPGGTVLLNADDPRVAAMRAPGSVRRLRFGADPSFDLWADEISARWPERLSLRLHAGDEAHRLDSRLVGAHWATSLLAAVAAARACGVPLAEAAARAEKVEPLWARLQPIALPSGATVLRDDFNGSIDSFEPALRVLEEARAGRRILVASDYTDSSERSRARAKRLGEEAARSADVAVFVGGRGERAAAAAIAKGLPPASVHSFGSVAEACALLRRELRDGDLVLLKGWGSHHLSRIYLGLIGAVACQRSFCAKMILCDCCPELGLRWTPALQGLMAPPDARV